MMLMVLLWIQTLLKCINRFIIVHDQILKRTAMFNRLSNSFRLLQKGSPLMQIKNYMWFSKDAQLATSAQEYLEKARNVAIIAHVDHGKTTLVDSLLRYGGVKISDQCAMDSNKLQREKGITILSKCTSINYNDHGINIVDTPGHQDFGGQVERIMDMVDGVCLVICATEGPMTQSKFVLKKALEQKVKPLVVINKVDRPTARVSEVITEVFDMFCDLNCPDHYLDYPIYFASGKNGWAVQNLKDEKKDISCILQGIIKHVPPPRINPQKSFSMLVTQTQPNSFYGKMLLGRINSGELIVGKDLKAYDQDSNLISGGKVTRILKKSGLSEIVLDKAYAGDIVLLSGFPTARVTHTLVEEGYPEKRIPCLKIDEPLMGVSISVNTSPLAGKEGTKFTLNDIKTRLKQEAQNDVALTVDLQNKNASSVQVRGRGDLHIGILLENLRRQGFEFSVTPPEIVYKKDPKTGERLQPIEKITFEVEDRFTNLIMDKMNSRQGIYLSSESANQKTKLEFICSTRALLGIRTELLNQTQGTTLIKSVFHQYKPYLGPLRRNNKGAIISMCEGVTTPYILKEIQKFGALFVRPGAKVYNGLVIGENNKEEDVEVNATKEKKVTNVRTHAHDEKVILLPPRVMSIEQAICYIRDDELLEITPKEVRIRKKDLDKKGRDTERRERKNQLKSFSRSN